MAARGEEGRRPLSINHSQPLTLGTDSADQSNRVFGQSNGPMDNAIVRWVIKGTDTVQTKAQCAQSCSAVAAEVQGEGVHVKGGEQNLGNCDSTAITHNLHENGKREETVNV